MARTQFRLDMRRGLGSCHLEMDRCGDIEAYREDILWGCLHARAYDTQSEGTRAVYLFEMIERFGDWTDFYERLAADAKRRIREYGWRFAHDTDILALMAGSGYAPAKQTLEALYGLLLHALQTGRPGKLLWPASDNYDEFCIEMLTSGLQSQAEKEAFFLRTLKDRGSLIRRRPALAVRFVDECLSDMAADALGTDRRDALLDSGREDPDVALYLETLDRLEREWNETREEIEQTAPSRTARQLGEYQNADEDQRAAILGGLRRFAVAVTAEEPDVTQLLADAESENETLRAEAWRLLSGLRDDRVRDLALRALDRDPENDNAIRAVIKNYRPGDEALVIAWVRSASLNEHCGSWHGVFWEVRDLIDENLEADAALSSTLLPYMYRKGFCSCCRRDVVEAMLERGLLTPALIAECRHDCNLEIRELVEAL